MYNPCDIREAFSDLLPEERKGKFGCFAPSALLLPPPPSKFDVPQPHGDFEVKEL